MVQHEGYYDYMLRRTKEENVKEITDPAILTIQEMQKEIHGLQIRVKQLSDENYRLREDANIYNN